ncbi:hypothetical protein PInf_024545 [Phytophthora infestans]|nr:hypothetical protein PInf_024545 [Phytophthora infestans]
MMYDRLDIISTTGMRDKNYRIYINYLRFYEFFKGPTHGGETLSKRRVVVELLDPLYLEKKALFEVLN